MVQSLQIDSLRAEITMFEAGRAYAAADNRATVTLADLATVAPMALRSRRSPFMAEFFALQDGEDQEIKHIAQSFLQPNAEETHE
jgi:magnesium chelatase subunit I